MLDVKIRVSRDWMMEVTHVLMFTEYCGQKKYLVPTFTEVDKPLAISDSDVISLTNDSAQMLFNGLWEQGFRPKDGTGNSGHVAALEGWLKDMRRLVFRGAENGKEI